MATKPREKLNFDLDQPQVAQPMPAAVATVPAAPMKRQATSKPVDTAPRKAVATRLPTDLYRQAKARAALDDVTIQTVIETALREYVGKPEGKRVAA